MTEEDKVKLKLVQSTLEVQIRAVFNRWGVDALFEVPILNELTNEEYWYEEEV